MWFLMPNNSPEQFGKRRWGTQKPGYPVDKVHDAAAWAIQLLMDRMEGKAATIQPEAEKGISAVERIGELAVETVNRLTEEAVGPPGPPPLLGPDGGTDASE